MVIQNSRLSDVTLVSQAQTGNKDAEYTLIKRYARLVSYLTKDLYMKGSASDDVYQEGMIGLLTAIRKFDLSRKASFHTFAELCVTNQCISATRSAGRLKHAAMNDSQLFGALTQDDDSEEYSTPDTTTLTPEEQVVSSDYEARLRLGIRRELSERERRVLAFYLQGYSYAHIAELIGVTPKAVDNALQRVRAKVATIHQNL